MMELKLSLPYEKPSTVKLLIAPGWNGNAVISASVVTSTALLIAPGWNGNSIQP